MINGFFRGLLALFFSFSGKMISWDDGVQRRKFRKRYAFFYGRNALGTFPVSGIEGQEERLREVYGRMIGAKYFARTSGTTGAPKLVPYDAKRTKFLRRMFKRSMITLTREVPGPKTFFVFASLKQDHSLTTAMASEEDMPSYFELLEAPYRYLHTEEGQELIQKVGELTARIMVLVITQPRFLYATNPSTLTYFLKELEERWKEVRVRLKRIPPGLMRLSDTNGERLLMTFLIRERAPSLQELLPDLKAVITWDGGYVRPFLDQLKEALPGIEFFPMFAMSTETVATLPHRIGERLHFFPIVKGVYPEFRDPETQRVLSPFELEKGKVYEFIVSDEWGLRRYATGDLFIVKDILNSLPDLAFLGRTGTMTSFAGEKLTEEHVHALVEVLGKRFPEISKLPMTFYPVSLGGKIGYELGLIGKRGYLSPELAEAAEEELSKINQEYASKVSSGELRPMTVKLLSEQELAGVLGRDAHWESQFKFLPLYGNPVLR